MSKGIIPTIMEQAGHQSWPTKEEIEKTLRNLFQKPKADSPTVTIWTGLRGRQTHEWYMRKGCGGIDEGQQRPGKMVAMLNYRHELVDTTGEIWRWHVVDGKVQWERMHACTFNGSPRRRIPTRFIEWEKSLPI